MGSVAEEKKIIPNLFDKSQNQEKENEAEDAIELSIEEVTTIKETIQNDAPSKYIQDLQKQAEQMSNEYNQKINEQSQSGNIDPLAAIIPTEMYYPINENYKEVVAEINLPVFYTKTVASIFSDDEWIPLEKSMLTKGFDLPSKDATVDFTIVRPQGVTIDVVESGDDYVPVRRNNQQAIDFIRQQYTDKSTTTQKDMLSKQIASMIKFDNVVEPDIKKYIDRVISGLDADAIASLVDNLYLTRDTIKEKIEFLLRDYQKQVFQQWLNVGKIQLKGHYTFIDAIAMPKEEMVGIDKGLYVAEETVNDFEYDVISAIADNPNVLFWHRNREKKDFCINGYINHYPDFIVRMKSGNTILVETKGDHLVNDDSKNKIWLGNKWADLAGSDYKYFMVFQTKEIEGAITVKQLLQYLNEL